MATTFLKSTKKKADGRPGLNRQSSVQTALVNHEPKTPKYQNTYRLEPYKTFNVEPVDKIVKQVMTNNLEDIVYDPKECPKLCAEISADIRNRIRKQNFDRYKIVVIVTINEKASQGIQTSMRFIWDVQRDNYSSFTFETRTFFAYCCVFGVYYEHGGTRGTSSLSKAASQQSRIGMSTTSLIPGHPVTSATYRNAKGGYKIPKYQNSYRLCAHNPFKQEIVDKILEDVMTTTLTGMKYNPEVCMKLCQDMTADIRNKIYRKDYDRYKFIVQITIIEKTGQSVQVSNGRLWDIEKDSYSTFTFESSQLYAAGIVVGVYYE